MSLLFKAGNGTYIYMYGKRVFLAHAQAKHRLKPVDKLIGKVEKLAVGEHPSNAYVVVSIGR